MKSILVVILLVIALPVFSQTQEKLYLQLDSMIARRDKVLEKKVERINSYKQSLAGKNLRDQYKITRKIFNEYKSFIYDSAFRYVRNLQVLAAKLKDPELINESKIDVGFILVSAGLFHQTLDTLESIKTKTLPDSIKGSFYYLIGRGCFDLAQFVADGFYSVRYNQRGRQYMDSAMLFLSKNDPQYLMLKGLKNVESREWEVAREDYEALINNFPMTDGQMAIATSTLSYVYKMQNRFEDSKTMVIKAAMADIRASTMETTALLSLARLLYEEGDIDKAYKYIKVALDDANFYGANHRKIQIAAFFPLIEGKRLSSVEGRKNALTFYAVGVTGLIFFMIVFAIILYRQFNKLQAAKKIISDSNEKLIETNHHLQSTQNQLIQTEKMAFIGRLTSGVAHEINTPLGAIKASAENVDTALDKMLEGMTDVSDHIFPHHATLVLDLIDYSSTQKLRLESSERRALKKNLMTELTNVGIENSESVVDYMVRLGITQDYVKWKSLVQSPHAKDIFQFVDNVASVKSQNANIRLAITKASKILFALKTYSYHDVTEDSVDVDLVENVETVLVIYSNNLKDIDLVRNFEQIEMIKGFPDELSQVWTNLIHNSLHAMGQQGRLEISIARQGDEIMIEFKDNGKGISPGDLEKIFQPFYTTKALGEGTGLGLPIVKKILNKHHGRIECESEPGKGATFRVFLPVTSH